MVSVVVRINDVLFTVFVGHCVVTSVSLTADKNHLSFFSHVLSLVVRNIVMVSSFVFYWPHDEETTTVCDKQAAQLSQRDRATLYVC